MGILNYDTRNASLEVVLMKSCKHLPSVFAPKVCGTKRFSSIFLVILHGHQKNMADVCTEQRGSRDVLDFIHEKNTNAIFGVEGHN